MDKLNQSHLEEMLDLLQSRYSCRSFSEEKISDEMLDRLLKIGTQAATGGNLQPVTIMAVTDLEKKKMLCEIGGEQKFIEEAAVDLVFFLDWHKLAVYAQHCRAPFLQHRDFSFLVIALMDVLCAAQAVESAATLAGIGSCYVGTVCGKNQFFCEHFNMPENKVFPVVLLSLGYPKKEQSVRVKKLDMAATVGYESYPVLSDEEIITIYDKKYKENRMNLPKKEVFRKSMLEELGKSLKAGFDEKEAEVILKEIEEKGTINELQRKFTFQYPAYEFGNGTKEVIESLHHAGILSQLKSDERSGQ